MKIIGDIYEVTGELGSGGGGVVYRARHTRLDKDVVIKVDKRRLTRSRDLYLREVNVLKELKNDHIPQVYDFFEEDGMVCTVMEFIKGESLDIPLKRGETFGQPQVIKWAEQILDALVYLHSPFHGDPPKGYVHSDIKPANIMRLPNGDVCLIDFNISLAIGEYSFIGRSAGYSSPEHYGFDFSKAEYASDETEQAGGDTLVMSEIADETATLAEDSRSAGYSSSSATVRRVFPDARSDIYSLGATMYHLLSGERPNRDARKVTPLSDRQFSPPLVKIITKAMDPDKTKRFQSAQEMLDTLKGLRQNDPRTKRLIRSRNICAAACSVLLVCGIGMSFVGLKRMQHTEEILKNAEYSSAALEQGDRAKAIEYALAALPEPDLLTPYYKPQAQLALTNALGVYDLADRWQSEFKIELGGLPCDIELSPDGKVCAVMTKGTLALYDTSDGAEIRSFLTRDTVAAEMKFIDDNLIAFAGTDGLCIYDLDNNELRTFDVKCTYISISQNRDYIAADDERKGVVVYRIADSSEYARVDFNGRKLSAPLTDSLLSYNRDKSVYNTNISRLFELSANADMIAVSLENGGMSVFDLVSGDESDIYDGEKSTRYSGCICDNVLGFSAYSKGDGGTDYIFLEMQDSGALKLLAEFFNENIIGELMVDEEGFIILSGTVGVRFDPYSYDQIPIMPTEQAINVINSFDHDKEHYILCANGSVSIYDRYENRVFYDPEADEDICKIKGNIALIANISEPYLNIIKYKQCESKQKIQYIPDFHHTETRISDDTILFYDSKALRITDKTGNVKVECAFDDPDTVYDTQFRRSGSGDYLEVIYKDGRIDKYSADDGKIFETEKGDVPNTDLSETCETEHYIMYSPADGDTVITEKGTGKELYLPKNDYPVYLYECSENILIHFVSAQAGDCVNAYGILYDGDLNELAYLENFCDIKDNTVYFDYQDGTIGYTEVYDIGELIKLAAK